MKYRLLLSCVLLCSLASFGQSSLTSVKKVTANNKILRVGDKMPDILLGEIINNKTGKTRFSLFKGKLVILDFWSSTCTSCIEGFPEMERLQRQFEDKVQIILVNTRETLAQINEVFKEDSRKKYILPDLPLIVNAKELGELFPSEWAGYQVWIDGEGVVRIINGSSFNSHEEKILDVLNGKKIEYVTDGRLYNKREAPLVPDVNKIASSNNYNTFFSGFNKVYGTAGGSAENIMDSTSRSVRSTFVNRDVLELYRVALKDFFDTASAKIIYSQNAIYNSSWLDLFLLEIRDTFKYTSTFHGLMNQKLTDQQYVKSKFCYEQVTPLHIPNQIRKKYMLEDLNRFFANLYGAKIRQEKHEITCYSLVRTTNESKLIDSGDMSVEKFTANGKKMQRLNNFQLASAINGVVRECSFIGSLADSIGGQSLFIIDDTGIKGKISIVLPESSELHSLDDLRKELMPYGLDIVKKEAAINFIVITE